jgi:type II secretory pathway pseudopilin PulG
LPLLIALGILALIILGLLVIFAARRLQGSPNRAMASAASPVNGRDAELMSTYAQTQKSQARPPLEHRPTERKPLPKDKVYDDSTYVDGGPIMLNLFVEDQNTAIGRRNIHTVKSGFSFSIGGGKSDFLVFLVPFPPNIANVQYDGRNCTFIPLKPQYFPDIGSQPIPNCIGKTIRVISDKNYELHIRIDRYEDPLKALNRLLNSISAPGQAK